jgi:hypothetical protein
MIFLVMRVGQVIEALLPFRAGACSVVFQLEILDQWKKNLRMRGAPVRKLGRR